MEQTVVLGRMQALLGGSTERLDLSGWTLDMTGQPSFVFGPCEVWQGAMTATDWRATGATWPQANAFTAVTAAGQAYDVLLVDCQVDTADNDCVSTKLMTGGDVAGSRLRIQGGHYWGCGDSPNDEMITGHSGLAVEVVGAVIDLPGAYGHAVLPDEQTPVTLLDCIIEGNVTASRVENCRIDAAGTGYGLALQQGMDGWAVNNHIFGLHPTDWAWAVQPRGGPGVVQTVMANLLEGGGDKNIAVKASSVAGTIEVIANRMVDFTHAVDLRGLEEDFTAGLVANNILEASAYAIMGDDNLKTTSRYNLIEQGRFYHHAAGPGDLFAPADLDDDGLPLPGGNCDYGRADGTLRPGTGYTDRNGRPKIFYDRDVIGPLFPALPLDGDLDLDGKVGPADWQVLMTYYDTRPPAADWTCGDMNLDGAVNGLDYQRFCQGYLDSHPGQPCPFTLPGDFNGDGQIEQADLNLLLTAWGRTEVGPDWMGRFDGLVDPNELDDLLTGWGIGLFETQAGQTVSMVPAPPAVGLVVVLGGMTCRRGGRQPGRGTAAGPSRW